MSSVNYPLIAEVLQSIRNHPELHNQHSWIGAEAERNEDLKVFTIKHTKVNGKDFLVSEGSCQTSACIAGWSLLHEGFEASDPWNPGTYNLKTHFQKFVSPEGEVHETYEIGEVAAKRLGVPEDQNYHQLFMDMDEERAIAQLIHLYDHGRLPDLTVYDDEGNLVDDFDASEDMDIYDRLVFNGMESDEFVEVQTKRFRELFPYTPSAKVTVNA